MGVQAFSANLGATVVGRGAGGKEKGFKMKLIGGLNKTLAKAPELAAASVVYAALAPELSDWVSDRRPGLLAR